MISRSHKPARYPQAYYDDDMCLKPPALLWIAVLYLARAITLPVAMGVGHFAGVSAEAMAQLRNYWSADESLPALLALPVLYALVRRNPVASESIRWIWARGRSFLVVSAALDIALRLAPLMAHRNIDDQFLPTAMAAIIDAYFLTYLVTARRVRDTFADFPPALPQK